MSTAPRPSSPAVATLTFAGAARGVTGSCYHLAYGADAVVIDCGVFQGDAEANANNHAPFPFDPRGVSGVVLTHGHLDHVGRLPLLFKHGFRGPVYGHPATLDIAMLILADSVKISNHSDEPPLYGEREVAAVRAALRPMGGYGASVELGGLHISIYDAGHILGSSSVRVQWGTGADQRAILFSGDLGMVGTPIIGDPNTHWEVPRDHIDYVITESTYGNREHPPRTEVRKQFRQVLDRALQDGGKVLIPAFSIGRTQEIIYELNSMVEAGELAGIPVIVDGPLGASATALYRKYKSCYDADAMALVERGDAPLEFDTLYAARDATASKRATNHQGPAIIIAGSGMLQGGRIRHHLRAHIDDPKTDILLVGYQAGRTLGRALQNGADEVWLGGDRLPVRARVTTLHGFSAHADRNVLLDWFDKLPRQGLRRAFVTHGEEAASADYAGLLRDRFGVAADVPALGSAVALG